MPDTTQHHFKPGQLFDPMANNDISGLTSIPGQSLGVTNTPAQLTAAGAFTPNIPVSNITPQTQFKTFATEKDFNDYNATLVGTQVSLPQQVTADKTQEEILKLMKEQGGQTAFQQQQEQAFGVPETQKAIKDLTSQLLSINTEAQQRQLELGKTGQPTFLTSEMRIREGNIERDRTIKALGVSASIQALQGNLQLANDQVQRAVDLKYAPIKQQLELLNKQLEFNYKSLDSAEKRRADALKVINDAKLRDLEIQRANEKDKNATLLNQMQSYPDAEITLTDTLESANLKITSKSKIYADKIRGPVGTATKPLDILDVARYNELYPDAGIVAGDTQAQANAKVSASNSPEAKTRNLIVAAKNNGNDYKTIVSEINKDTTIKDKATAIKVAQEVYGVGPTTETKQVFGTGNFAKISLSDQIAKLQSQNIQWGFGKNTGLREQLFNEGYPIEEIDSTLSHLLTGATNLINAITSTLFGK